jgi:hypothetical protein
MPINVYVIRVFCLLLKLFTLLVYRTMGQSSTLRFCSIISNLPFSSELRKSDVPLILSLKSSSCCYLKFQEKVRFFFTRFFSFKNLRKTQEFPVYRTRKSRKLEMRKQNQWSVSRRQQFC